MVDQKQIQRWIKNLQSKNIATQSQAAYKLGELGDESVISAILSARNYDSEEHGGIIDFDRTPPIEMIAQRRGVAALATLIDLVKNIEVENLSGFQAYSIQEGLVAIGSPAVEPVIELLSHPSSIMRFYAIKILGEIGDVRALKPLMEIARSHLDWDILKVISQLDESGTEALLEFWNPENHSIRFYIVRALSQLKSANNADRIRDLLTNALQDDYWLVKMNAIDALGEFGNEHTVDLLIPFLSDQTYFLQAATALRQIGTPQALQAVEAWQRSKTNNE